jgi:hypothetical protein
MFLGRIALTPAVAIGLTDEQRCLSVGDDKDRPADLFIRPLSEACMTASHDDYGWQMVTSRHDNAGRSNRAYAADVEQNDVNQRGG